MNKSEEKRFDKLYRKDLRALTLKQRASGPVGAERPVAEASTCIAWDTLFTTPSAAAPPVTAPAAFRSIADPQRSYCYASGPLARETRHPRHLTTPHYDAAVNQVAKASGGCASSAFCMATPKSCSGWCS